MVDVQWVQVILESNPTKYEISNMGEVRNSNTGKLLKCSNIDGFQRTVLYIKGKLRSIVVHKLVAEAFLPNPKKLPQICHKDGIRSNNKLDNLIWGYKKRGGGRKKSLKESLKAEVDISGMTLKEVPQYPTYMASDTGKIYSKRSRMFLKTNFNKNYETIHLCGKTYQVHRLIALTFIENPNNYKQVNHKDGNKLNNSCLNLEWVTQSQNMQHAITTGLKPTKGGVEQYNLKGELIAIHKSLRDAAAVVGIDKAAISRCCLGKQKSCGCYIWKYKTEEDIHIVSLTRTKCIEQYTLNGEFIECFQTLKEAADKIGRDYSTIAKCCRGKRKTCGGYTWKYRDENVVTCKRDS